MKVVIKNKDAYRNFELFDTFIGGIQLSGGEVKSIKKSQGSLQGSFLTLHKNNKGASEIFIKNMFVPPYQIKNTGGGYDGERMRKVLIKKREIAQIERELNNKGTTLIPIAVGVSNNLIKIEFGLARGKKKYDKRQDLKERAQKRDAERENKIRFT